MQDINYVIVIGRLTRDAELKYTNSGLAVSSFAIATNRSKKKGDNWEDETSFFDIALFGKRAEGLNQYLTKGQQVAVEGHLEQDRWEQDGQKKSKVRIGTQNVQLLGGGKAKPQTGAVAPPREGLEPEFEDDIPF